MALTKVTGQVINTSTDVTVGVLTVTNTLAVGGTVSIGGTLTYEDVTNIDSVGLITARNGIIVGSGITLSKDGDIFATGVTTATSFVGDGSQLTGVASTENIRTNTNATFLQNINVSGTSTVGGDINIADKIVHIGDTNTAIRFPAADTITAETGGSERARIDANGRFSLGVGDSPGSYPTSTTARQVQAEFKGAIDTGNNKHDGSLALNCTNNNANLYIIRSQDNQTSGVALGNINFLGYDGTDYHVASQITGARDATGGNNDIPGRLTFLTTADGASSPTERLRIDSSGRLLLGTTTEGQENADDLTVAGSSNSGITIRSGTSSFGQLFFSDGTSGDDEYRGIVGYSHADNFMKFHTNAVERLRIDSSGRLLLGTTSANHYSDRMITINRDAGAGIELRNNSSSTGQISFSDTSGSGVGAYRGYIQFQHNNVSMHFGTNNTERLRIDSGGKLIMGSGGTTNDTSERFLVDGSASGDHCGMGIKTNNNLHDGYIAFHDTDATYRGKLVYDHEVDDMFFHVNGGEKLRITSTGNVSINNGNLIFGTNGNALDFQNQTIESTSNYNRQVTAEKIDYYEEGYLDPTAISSGLTWDTSNNRQLRYVRIGNWVSVSGLLIVSSRTSNTEAIKVAMPYTSAPNSSGYYTRGVGAVMYQYVSTSSNFDDIVAYVGGGENYMRFFQVRNDGGGWTELLNQNLGGNASTQIYFSVNYMVA